MPEGTSVVLLIKVDAPHVSRFLMHCDLLQIVPCMKLIIKKEEHYVELIDTCLLRRPIPLQQS